tara:strand:- start:80 stop:397 length:318 start_codon:yes stop_codon:yes gene_type:complete
MMNETELYFILIFSTVGVIIYFIRDKISEYPIRFDLFRGEAKKVHAIALEYHDRGLSIPNIMLEKPHSIIYKKLRKTVFTASLQLGVLPMVGSSTFWYIVIFGFL